MTVISYTPPRLIFSDLLPEQGICQSGNYPGGNNDNWDREEFNWDD